MDLDALGEKLGMRLGGSESSEPETADATETQENDEAETQAPEENPASAAEDSAVVSMVSDAVSTEAREVQPLDDKVELVVSEHESSPMDVIDRSVEIEEDSLETIA